MSNDLMSCKVSLSQNLNNFLSKIIISVKRNNVSHIVHQSSLLIDNHNQGLVKIFDR